MHSHSGRREAIFEYLFEKGRRWKNYSAELIQGNGTPYTEELLRVLESQRKIVKEPRGTSIIEPLTDRERDILRCLDADMTVPEMADSLVISIGTVRTHIKRIYRKLDVHSRFEAVTKARQLNLIDKAQIKN